ncbi:ABC transporter permease [Aeromicrobium sp.]|uniref:ABC transporter permease n=1 Tax=Aeromicrobium sp. TaxID=1871063 RepID=UPI0025C20813|nr:ABC transporter permease [Aeromicrobium sp.]MCK5890543.1 ABC transporter permease [Aeromicrobium sp.]
MSTSTPARGAWRLVAEREITTRVREKAFLIGVAVTVVLVAGAVVAASLLSGRSSTEDIAVVGPEAAAIVQSADDGPIAQGGDTSFEAVEVASLTEAERALQDERVDAALVPGDDGGFRIIGLSSVDSTTEQALTAAVSQTVLQANAAAQDVDLDALSAGTTTTTSVLEKSPENEGARTAVATVMVILFLLTVMIFGLQIAQSVTQEKESRVVEILAAAVPIRALLWGKIAGNTVLALGQVVLVVVAGVGAALAVGELPFVRDVGWSLVWFLVLFLLGFVAMATLWAVAGSLASRVQDINSTTLPIQGLLFVPYFAVFAGNDSLTEVVSMVPIAATMVMPMRLATETVPAWQLGVAIGGTILAAVLLVRLGVRIYERSLLRTGTKLGYREALSLAAD